VTTFDNCTKTYYLSGPMRGLPDYNYPQFAEVTKALAGHVCAMKVPAWTVLNPAENFHGDVTRNVTDYLNIDLRQVLEADVIVLLPNWHKSEGASREVQLATWAGKEFWLAINRDDEYESEGYKRPNPEFGWEFAKLEGPPSPPVSLRQGALDEAGSLITGDRNNSYGPPTQDFARTADALNAYGYRGPDGRLLRAHDTAIMIMLVKISRLMWTPKKRDSWVDTAGYAGCGYECAMTEDE
jgi:hypothetical protein